MIDITTVIDGLDIGVYDTQNYKASNILSVQLGSLEYAQDLGIDLVYFLTEKTKFQEESFKAYCTEVLANRGINVTQVLTTESALSTLMNFELTPVDTTTGMIAE